MVLDSLPLHRLEGVGLGALEAKAHIGLVALRVTAADAVRC